MEEVIEALEEQIRILGYYKQRHEEDYDMWRKRADEYEKKAVDESIGLEECVRKITALETYLETLKEENG